ncbi:hypothetical protein CNMCM8927_000230 [Aspergillus lentulus]|uniref:Uncharacterized protein n=1 Tax=Aspergillus lentulus TaxID=293939 RepID=A0AAN5YJQ7_ASPLE|nr:hypothetical protein CNMCM8927_000230 [Aspergillus lentulus]
MFDYNQYPSYYSISDLAPSDGPPYAQLASPEFRQGSITSIDDFPTTVSIGNEPVTIPPPSHRSSPQLPPKERRNPSSDGSTSSDQAACLGGDNDALQKTTDALFLRMVAEMKDDLAKSEQKIDALTKTLANLKNQINIISDSLSKVSNQAASYDRRLGGLSNILQKEAKRFRKGTMTVEAVSANFKHLLRRLAKQSNSIWPLLSQDNVSQNRQTPDNGGD